MESWQMSDLLLILGKLVRVYSLPWVRKRLYSTGSTVGSGSKHKLVSEEEGKEMEKP